jgi:hypothetical protein
MVSTEVVELSLVLHRADLKKKGGAEEQQGAGIGYPYGCIQRYGRYRR